MAVKEINRKSCCPFKGPQNATHSREEDYIRVECFGKRGAFYYYFRFGRAGIIPKDVGVTSFGVWLKYKIFNGNHILFLNVEIMSMFGVQ